MQIKQTYPAREMAGKEDKNTFYREKSLLQDSSSRFRAPFPNLRLLSTFGDFESFDGCAFKILS